MNTATVHVETLGLVSVEYELESYPYPYPGGPVTLQSAIRLVPGGTEMDVFEVLTAEETEEIKDAVLELEQIAHEREEAAKEDAAEAAREERLLERKEVNS